MVDVYIFWRLVLCNCIFFSFQAMKKEKKKKKEKVKIKQETMGEMQ
jgi:hypothetical protein